MPAIERSDIGLLFMPRLEVEQYFSDAAYAENIRSLVTDYCVLGFCVFHGTPALAAEVIDELQNIAKAALQRQLIFSCDAEWGLPMRFKGGTEFPHAMALAKTEDLALTESIGEAIGSELSSIGIHWCFAPVADVNSNLHNPIINIRSFGESKEVVANAAVAFHHGLKSSGVFASAKHFPGHGDTMTDTHHALAVINKSLEELTELELYPFRALIHDGITSIMTAHIASPKLAVFLGASAEEQYKPATISHYVTHILLRTQLQFDGIIVTDSLEMSGIRDGTRTDAEISLQALSAGADVLLMSPDTISSFNLIYQVSAEDEQIRSYILNSLGRIRRDLLDSTPLIERSSPDWKDHKRLSQLAARKAIHMTGTVPPQFLPHIVSISNDGSEAGQKKALYLESLLRVRYSDIVFTNERYGDSLHIVIRSPRGRLVDEKLGTYDSATQIGKSLGLCLVGNPYLLSEAPETDFTIYTYSDCYSSIEALVDYIVEESKPH